MTISRNLIILIITIFLLIALPLTIYLVRQQQNLRPKATGGSVSFTLTDPQPGTKQTGQVFNIDLKIEAGTDALNKARATVIYDPSELTLVSFTAASGLNTFGQFLQPDPAPANSTTGTMTYEAVDFHDPNPSGGATKAPNGTINLGTLVFRAGNLAPAQTTIGINGALAGNAITPNMQTATTPITITIGNTTSGGAESTNPTPASSSNGHATVINNPVASCNGTTSQVQLSWSNVGADTYRITRWLNNGQPISTSLVVLGSTTQTTYLDTTVVAGVSYIYQAEAIFNNQGYTQGGAMSSATIPVTALNCNPSPSPNICSGSSCWVQGGQCTNQQGANNYCNNYHGAGSTCDPTNTGYPYLDGCGCPTGSIFCSRTNTCTLPNTCFPPSPSPSASSTTGCTTSNGDANKDGHVDLLDHRIWVDEFLNVVSTKRADFNCDGVVDLFTDFIIWKRSYAP